MSEKISGAGWKIKTECEEYRKMLATDHPIHQFQVAVFADELHKTFYEPGAVNAQGNSILEPYAKDREEKRDAVRGYYTSDEIAKAEEGAISEAKAAAKHLERQDTLEKEYSKVRGAYVNNKTLNSTNSLLADYQIAAYDSEMYQAFGRQNAKNMFGESKFELNKKTREEDLRRLKQANFSKEEIKKAEWQGKEDAKLDCGVLRNNSAFVRALYGEHEKLYHVWDNSEKKLILSTNSPSTSYESLQDEMKKYVKNPELMRSDMGKEYSSEEFQNISNHYWSVEKYDEEYNQLYLEGATRVEAEFGTENIDLSTKENYSKNFAKEVQKERPDSKIKEGVTHKVYDEKHRDGLNFTEIIKRANKELEKQESKSQSRTQAKNANHTQITR